MAASDMRALLKEYRRCSALYGDLASTVSQLLAKIVSDNGVSLHSVSHRLKAEESLAKKLQSPGRSYASLGEVTDLAGVRVTTYFHDHVDRVATLIDHEFVVDQQNSVDKRLLLDPDRFGYLSLHYVVELSQERCLLPEYKRFKGLKVEIQIRSLLQHVWAEVEHDLGYKSTRSVPSAIRRRFSRLAGLLELADAEFAAIREELGAYERMVPDLIASAPASVALDKASLAAYAKESKLLNELDTRIGSFAGATIVTPAPGSFERNLERLSFVGIASIGDLDNALRNHRRGICEFARLWLDSEYETLDRGISIFYLAYVILAHQRDRNRIRDYVEKFTIGATEERAALADKVLAIAARAGVVEPAS
jgi:ppGpp synthetase/RelA/SpoT-type nucleotidyltranferase